MAVVFVFACCFVICMQHVFGSAFIRGRLSVDGSG